MNASNTQDDLLKPFIDAAREPVQRIELDAAADRLRARLPQPVAAGRTWRLAGAGALVMVAVVLAPFLLGDNGHAFAAVQKWFEDYQTVHVSTEMSQNGTPIMQLQTWSDRSGSARIEMDAVVHILDTETGLMHTLLPGDRVMSVTIATAPVGQDPRAALQWLQQIRSFQGQAEALPEKRIINGEETAGYRLAVDGSEFTLWAETRDNRPTLIEANLPGGLLMRSEMVFDQPLPEDVFAVPPHYLPVQED